MASDLVMGSHYGNSHMPIAIVNIYRPATFDCMEKEGDRIRRMRVALGMTQGDLAALVGVDQSKVSDAERGASFTASMLMRFAQHLETTPAMIMLGKDDATWPFDSIPIELYLQLNEKQRAYVEGVLAKALGLEPSPEDLQRFKSSHESKVKPTQRKRAA